MSLVLLKYEIIFVESVRWKVERRRGLTQYLLLLRNYADAGVGPDRFFSKSVS